MYQRKIYRTRYINRLKRLPGLRSLYKFNQRRTEKFSSLYLPRDVVRDQEVLQPVVLACIAL